MTIRYTSPEEWWPVLVIGKSKSGYDNPAEFTDEELADILRIQKEFNDWQVEFAKRAGLAEPHPFTLVEE